MESQHRDSTKLPTRRESEPRQRSHRHTQPTYPEYLPRRHTYEDGSKLTKVHSRPEDYKKYRDRLRTDNMFQYICFGGEHPQECDETTHTKASPEATIHEGKEHLDRYNSRTSNESSSWTRTDDSGNESDDELEDDSEDELTLPPTYQHDVCHRDDEACEWFNANPRKSEKKPDESHASNKPNAKRHHADADLHPAARHDLAWRDHAYHDYHDSPGRRHSSRSPSPSSHQSPSSSQSGKHSPEPTQRESYLIAKVAKHLMAHRQQYKHESAKQIANELLGEVVRKVADGTLDGNTMKEVIREVQHVL